MQEDKEAAVRRLAQLEGQIRGVAKMIEEDRYCVDILNQTTAVRAALSKVEMLVLKAHADECVQEAIVSRDMEAQRAKFRELVDLFEKVCG